MEEIRRILKEQGYTKEQVEVAVQAIAGSFIKPELYAQLNEVVTITSKYAILKNKLGAITNDDAPMTPIKKASSIATAGVKPEPKPRTARVKKEEPQRYSAPDGPSEDEEEAVADKPVLTIEL